MKQAMTKSDHAYLSGAGRAKRTEEQWVELRSVFPIYLALAKQLGVPIPFAQQKSAGRVRSRNFR